MGCIGDATLIPTADFNAATQVLGADESGVECPGAWNFAGALNDRATVGKDAERVGRAREAEHHAVPAHVAERTQACREFREVNGPRMFMNLNGIATAHGDVGSTLACEVAKLVPGADGAACAWFASLNFTLFAGPEIHGKQRAAHSL